MTPRAQPKSIETPLSDFSHLSDQQLKEIGQFGASQEPNVSNGSPQNREKNIKKCNEKGGLGRSSK